MTLKHKFIEQYLTLDTGEVVQIESFNTDKTDPISRADLYAYQCLTGYYDVSLTTIESVARYCRMRCDRRYTWDDEQAQLFNEFAQACNYGEGIKQGEPVEIIDYQNFYFVYACCAYDEHRHPFVKFASQWIGRGNAKTFNAAFILMLRTFTSYGICNNLVVADKYDTAEITIDYIAKIINESDDYIKKLFPKITTGEIENAFGSNILACPAVAGFSESKRCHTILYDEMHLIKNAAVVRNGITALGSTKNSMQFCISTAGENIDCPAYKQDILKGREMNKNKKDDMQRIYIEYCCEYRANEFPDDLINADFNDPPSLDYAVKQLYQSMPSLQYSRIAQVDIMTAICQDVVPLPVFAQEKKTFLIKYANLWQRGAASSLVSADLIDNAIVNNKVTIQELIEAGAKYSVGIDAAQTKDVCGIVFAFSPIDNEDLFIKFNLDTTKILIISESYLPADMLKYFTLDQRQQYEEWIERSAIKQYSYLSNNLYHIFNDHNTYYFSKNNNFELYYDPALMSEYVNAIEDEYPALLTVKLIQSPRYMAEPINSFVKLFEQSKVQILANDIALINHIYGTMKIEKQNLTYYEKSGVSPYFSNDICCAAIFACVPLTDSIYRKKEKKKGKPIVISCM